MSYNKQGLASRFHELTPDQSILAKRYTITISWMRKVGRILQNDNNRRKSNSIGVVLRLKPELELEYSQKAFYGGQLTVAVKTNARKRDRDLRKYEKRVI